MPELHSNPAQDYLDAERALTEAHAVAIVSPDGVPLGERLAAPLLQTLAANVNGGLVRGGAASQASTRTPLNVGAADLLAAIRGRVLEDYRRMVGGGARPDTAVALKAIRLPVLNRWRAQRVSGGELRRRTGVLLGWGQAVTDLLDPPFRIDLLSPCPRCGETWALDDDGDQVAALCTTYRDVRDALNQCRACGATWFGIDGARRLSIAIEEAERMRTLLLGATG